MASVSSARRRVCVVIVACVVVWVVGCEERPRGGSAAAGGARAASGVARVVVLSPAVGVMVRDLGFAQRVVGRHGFDMALDATLPVCGDQTGLDYEALVRVKPTHVLIEWGERELPAKLVDMAGASGWRVETFTLRTLEDVESAARRVHVMLAQKQRPFETLPLAMEMMEAWSSRDGEVRERRGRVGSVLLLAATDPPGAMGPGSFHHQVLERVGATPALMTGAMWQTLDAEDVARLSPGAIIVFRPRGRGEARRGSDVAVDMGEALGPVLSKLDVPAVRLGRVVVIDDPLGLLPSTALVGVTREMERVLDQWAEATR